LAADAQPAIGTEGPHGLDETEERALGFRALRVPGCLLERLAPPQDLQLPRSQMTVIAAEGHETGENHEGEESAAHGR
jgi:hypothetical protein